MTIEVCALCRFPRRLVKSHIIPSFVFKWLKDTSVTGHIRDVRHGSQRVQDGPTLPLLCAECELLLSKSENSFKRGIFRPFTKDYLDLAGRIVKDGYLEYDKWLDRFIISIIWRSFVSHFFVSFPGGLAKPVVDRITFLVERWRRYLLGQADGFGKVTNYVLFLRNIHEGTGELPPDISPRIVHYLMRSIDGALIYNSKLVAAMMKLGPVMVMTSIKPSKISGYPNSAVHTSGKLKVQQTWSNADLNSYLFVSRPNELDKLRGRSRAQQAQVDRAFEKNLDRVDKTMTMPVLKSDAEKMA